MPATDAPRDPHISKDQDPAAAATHGDYSDAAVDLLSQQYSNHTLYKQQQQQQYTHEVAPFDNPDLASYPRPCLNATAAYPTAPAAEAPHNFLDHDQQQQHYQQQQQLLLPEAAPAPKTDPVELSLLASYLEVVRQTQGDAAAAEALAASGADAASLGNAVTSSGTSGPGPYSSATQDGTWQTGAAGGIPGSTTAVAAGGAAAEDNLAVNNLLGFIKQRKLTGLPQPAGSRRPSSGAASTASSTAGSTAGQQATNAAGRKIWIQPSGE